MEIVSDFKVRKYIVYSGHLPNEEKISQFLPMCVRKRRQGAGKRTSEKENDRDRI